MSLSISRLITRDRLRVYPALMLIVVLLFSLHNVYTKGVHSELGGDFLSFYTGGSFILQGNAEGLAHGGQQQAFQALVRHSKLDGTCLWVSPPFFAWAFAPLAKLPFFVAYALFTALSVALCAAAFRAFGSSMGGKLSTGRLLWMAAQFYPTLQWFIIGQTTGLWLSVFVFIFVLLRQERDKSAGLLLGLLACKPTLAIGLAIGLLAARRIRALLCAGVSAGALVGLGFLTVPGAMLRYLHAGPKLVSLVRYSGYPTSGLFGSFEFATNLLDGFSRPLATFVGFVIFAALLGTIASLWVRTAWRPGSASWDLRMAATLALGVVASPHLFSYDLMLLVLPFFIVLARQGHERDRRVLEASVWAWLLALASPLLSPTQQVATRWLFGFSVTLQVSVLAVVAWALYVHRSNMREEQPLLTTDAGGLSRLAPVHDALPMHDV